MTLELWQTLISLLALVLAVVVAIYSWRHTRLGSITVLVWWGIAYLFSVRGFFQSSTSFSEGDLVSFFIFGTLMSIPLVLFVIARWRSTTFRDFVDHIPLTHLTAFEVYRLGGVIFFWLWSVSLMPVEMGFFTGFADTFIGVTALPLAWALARGVRSARRVAVPWHIFGIGDFVIAVSFVSLAIFGITNPQPSPAMIGLHPLALISLFQLPLSIIVHGLALRQLMTERETKRATWQLESVSGA
jgi:hypothetical protein